MGNHGTTAGGIVTSSQAHCLQQRDSHHPVAAADVVLGSSYPCMTRSHHYDPLGLASTYSHTPRTAEAAYQAQYSTAAAASSAGFYLPSYHSLYSLESVHEKN